MILPEGGTKSWTATDGETKLEKGAESIACKEVSTEATAEEALGSAHMILKNCTAAGIVKCTGLGDEAGIILLEPSWHYVYDTLRASLSEAGIAILFSMNSAHFECSGRLLSVSSGGMVLCLVANPTALTKTFEFQCKGSKGKPEHTEYFDDEEERVTITPLMIAENEGTEAEAAVVTSGKMTYNEAILLMF